jgi:hypothetical protein
MIFKYKAEKRNCLSSVCCYNHSVNFKAQRTVFISAALRNVFYAALRTVFICAALRTVYISATLGTVFSAALRIVFYADLNNDNLCNFKDCLLVSFEDSSSLQL